MSKMADKDSIATNDTNILTDKIVSNNENNATKVNTLLDTDYSAELTSTNNKLISFQYITYESRLASFNEISKSVDDDKKHNQLAEAGFYYTSNNTIKCYYCGGICEKFDPNNDAWVKHANLFPNCKFVIKNNNVVLIQKQLLKNKLKNILTDIIKSNSTFTYIYDICSVKCESFIFMEIIKFIAIYYISDKNIFQEIAMVIFIITICSMIKKYWQKITLKPENIIHSPDYNNLKEENQLLKKEKTCKMCENNVCSVFIPCKDLVTCKDCSLDFNRCPKCKIKIDSIVNINSKGY